MRLQQFIFLLVPAAMTLTCGGTEAAQLQRASVVTEQSSSLASSVDDFIRDSSGPAWITWDVPVNDPESQMCCFSSIDVGQASNWKGGSCALEERSNITMNFGSRDSALEKKRETFSIFLRAEKGQLSKVRTFSEDCLVDAGGVTVKKLTGINAEESVSYLAALLKRNGERSKKEANHLVSAIGMHRASNMTSTLEKIIHGDLEEDTRGHAAFWLGMKGGAAGRKVLVDLLDRDASKRVQEQAVAGIAQDHSRESIDALLKLARRHEKPSVRKHAIFWLGQIAGDRMEDELEAATEDEDEDVKEMAVFAISQLPKEQAIPSLINLVKTHKSPSVRHRAIFWLGQSGDPRALDFIEEVLTRN
jgi:HEAT repeat protein